MLTSMLLEASGAGTGFSGGTEVDHFPHLTLTEATAAIPTDINDFLMECIDVDAKISEDRVAALIESASYGTPVDADALVEAGFESIKQTIVNFFQRLKKWLQSVIAKVTAFIDTFTKTGRQLASKYSADIKSKETAGAYKDLEFNGYQYIDNIASEFVYDKFSSNISNVVGECSGISGIINPSNFKAEVGSADADSLDSNGRLKSCIDAMKDAESSAVIASAIAKITGINDVGDNRQEWKASLLKKLQGGEEKLTIKYGTGWFSANKLLSYFANPADWKAVQNQYKKLQAACNAQERQMIEVTDVKGMKTDDKAARKKKEMVSKYLNDYMHLVGWCWDAMTFVTNIKVQAIKSCDAQAKSMLGKLVNTGVKKKKDEDFELDDSDFEFDFA